MEFKGHFRGAVVAGALANVVALQGGYIHLDQPLLKAFVDRPLSSPAFHLMVALFATAFVMALFPDLDTQSVPQRWFLRTAFAGLLLTLYLRQMDYFAAIALFALLPLLHKHRGWTHSIFAPWAVFALVVGTLEYLRTGNTLTGGHYTWAYAKDTVDRLWGFLAAAVLGHYTHLLLDMPPTKLIPFLKNPPDHH